MGSRLFIGNISFSTTKEDLKAEFSAFGSVTDSFIVMDRETGRSRGFGFVTFADDSSAQEAIASMNGVVIGGRPIRVSEAEERSRPSGRSSSSGQRNGPPAANFEPEFQKKRNNGPRSPRGGRDDKGGGRNRKFDYDD